jgi:hypothetical protein
VKVADVFRRDSAEATFHDASATLHEVAHVQGHLAAQDELLLVRWVIPEASQVTIRSMLFAMSQRPKSRLPTMITWSVWVSIQVRNLVRNAWLRSGRMTA